MMSAVRAVACLAALVVAGASHAQTYPERQRAHRRALSARRSDRRHRAARRAKALGSVRSAVLRRERQRRERRARRRPGRRRSGRRIHADVRHQRSRGHVDDLHEDPVRPDQELRADRHRLGVALGRAGASVGAGEDDAGVHPARARRSCEIQLRRDESRAEPAHQREAVSPRAEPADHPGALSRARLRSSTSTVAGHTLVAYIGLPSAIPLHQGRHACARWRSPARSARRSCPTCRPWPRAVSTTRKPS